jgi:hypothetical protein
LGSDDSKARRGQHAITLGGTLRAICMARPIARRPRVAIVA